MMHPKEEEYLANVAQKFGFSDTEFQYIKARHVASNKRNPYDVLGITPEIADDALKSHYRKLVAENHPDKHVAAGMPEEFIELANEKIAAINEAYDQIAKERGL
jgi:DnaJ like chaperone protein